MRQGDIMGVTFMALVFLALIGLNFGLNFVQKIMMEYTGHMMMHDLRMALFRHIQSLAISFFTSNPVGRLVTRATNDVQNMHELFTSVITLVFKDFFLLVGIAAVLLFMDWRLALVSFRGFSAGRLRGPVLLRPHKRCLQGPAAQGCRNQHDVFRNHRRPQGDPGFWA